MTKKRRQFWFALTWAPLGAFFGTIVFGTLGIACMITPIPLLYRWAKTPTPPTPAIENPALRPMVVLTKHGDTWR
jgi:hypothetical protein